MTAKDKALRLCQQFGRTTMFAEDCNNGYTLPLRVAKICAHICVDEILEALDLVNEKHNRFGVEFYQQVKKEIENL